MDPTVDLMAKITAAVVVAVPVVIAVGTGVLLAVGGIIGCARCALTAFAASASVADEDSAFSSEGRLST